MMKQMKQREQGISSSSPLISLSPPASTNNNNIASETTTAVTAAIRATALVYHFTAGMSCSTGPANCKLRLLTLTSSRLLKKREKKTIRVVVCFGSIS